MPSVAFHLRFSDSYGSGRQPSGLAVLPREHAPRRCLSLLPMIPAIARTGPSNRPPRLAFGFFICRTELMTFTSRWTPTRRN
jgi:hypothetical protein